jgi:hypothetical protein
MPDIKSLASRIDAEKFYFIGEETRREFAKQNGIVID